jgi:hypothetical protein
LECARRRKSGSSGSGCRHEGLVDKPLTADQFWNGRFVEYANRVLSGKRTE